MIILKRWGNSCFATLKDCNGLCIIITVVLHHGHGFMIIIMLLEYLVCILR